MAACVHCNFSCVLQINTISSPPDEKNFTCNATIQGPPTKATIDGLQKHDTMTVMIDYYNFFDDLFKENAMIFCFGTLAVYEQDSNDSSLKVWSHCLIR
jgi:hypothetical protein